MKKIFLVFSLLLTFTAGLTVARSGFPDVPTNAWFHQYVMAIKDWGVINGNDDGTFAPGNNITRAEFSKMLFQYDKRVDQKISNIDSSSSASVVNSGSSLPSIMYLRRGDVEPGKCPSGWSDINYARQWKDGPMERICMTNKSCQALYLDAYNKEPNACPSGWSQAEFGSYWSEGGQSKYLRTCYICE